MKELSDGEMQNELKLYGEDPGPIIETKRLMHERRLAKQLDGPTPLTKLFFNLFFFGFVLFFFIFFFLIIYFFFYLLFNLLIRKKKFFHIFIS